MTHPLLTPEHLRTEAADLDRLIGPLDAFMGTKEFRALPVEHRSWMDHQITAMKNYAGCLAARIAMMA